MAITNTPVQSLLQQKMLLEAFRQLTEQMGLQRKVKRGDAWYPLRPGRSYWNSLNQLCIEVHRTGDEEIEHNFEFGRPVVFFKLKEEPTAGKNGRIMGTTVSGKTQTSIQMHITGTVSYVSTVPSPWVCSCRSTRPPTR